MALYFRGRRFNVNSNNASPKDQDLMRQPSEVIECSVFQSKHYNLVKGMSCVGDNKKENNRFPLDSIKDLNILKGHVLVRKNKEIIDLYEGGLLGNLGDNGLITKIITVDTVFSSFAGTPKLKSVLYPFFYSYLGHAFSSSRESANPLAVQLVGCESRGVFDFINVWGLSIPPCTLMTWTVLGSDMSEIDSKYLTAPNLPNNGDGGLYAVYIPYDWLVADNKVADYNKLKSLFGVTVIVGRTGPISTRSGERGTISTF